MEEAGDGNSDHQSILCLFTPMHSKRMTCAAPCHSTTASFTSQTHTTKGHIWIYLHYNNSFCDCVLRNAGRINICKCYVLYICKCERNGGIKTCASLHHLDPQIKNIICFFSPSQSRSLVCIMSTIHLNHLFKLSFIVSHSHSIVIITYSFRNGCLIVSPFSSAHYELL